MICRERAMITAPTIDDYGELLRLGCCPMAAVQQKTTAASRGIVNHKKFGIHLASEIGAPSEGLFPWHRRCRCFSSMISMGARLPRPSRLDSMEPRMRSI